MSSFDEWRNSASESEIALELINRRQRQVLVHSFIYYQMNENVISDHTFDRRCKELVELRRNHPKEHAASIYVRDFADFDGSSGFDLPYHLPDIQAKAMRLLG